LSMAREKGLDLILVSDNPANPVAKIEELSKAKYEKIKKLKKNAKTKAETKEWWFYPNIQDRDMEIRLEKVKEFIAKGGGTAKLTLKARGKTSPALMQETMAKIKEKSLTFSKLTTDITREGRNLSLIIRSN
jgi:translation initiation factor IF-3